MKYLAPLFALTLAACSSTAPTNTPDGLQYSNTMEIIFAAAEVHPRRVAGDWVLPIRAAGNQRSIVYLNTELDYRDPRSVSIALLPNVVNELASRYGENPETFLVGQTVRVRGEAQTTRINFYCETDAAQNIEADAELKYYFQTHILIGDVRQIKIIANSID